MSIKLLSDSTINKIAAGEVVERPLAVVKELVENSIDAGATSISVVFTRGGRTLISVSDNGSGIGHDELPIAIKRHATSKLDESDIDKISFLGFRGEALPSIAAVSKMKIISCVEGESAWEMLASGGEVNNPIPCVRNAGTTIEVRDLFCFTPSRLKFLKSESYENSSCIDLITKFALSLPNTEFKLTMNDKVVLHVNASNIANEEDRIEKLLNKSFVENTIPLNYQQGNIKLSGRVSLPTFHNTNSFRQYLYVNNRMVKDKLLIGAMRAAYANLIPSGRYPMGIVFLEIDNDCVDVNVHPTKAEVRFKDEQKIRGAVINGIRDSIAGAGLNQSTTTTDKAITYMQKSDTRDASLQLKKKPLPKQMAQQNEHSFFSYKPSVDDFKIRERLQKPDGFSKNIENEDYRAANEKVISNQKAYIQEKLPKEELVKKDPPERINQRLIEDDKVLGVAKCQINKTYIVAETEDGIVLVDQHAAHERLVLEQMKEQVKNSNIAIQHLLIPEVVELGQGTTIKILEKTEELKKFGVIIERNGISQILVSAIPAILGKINIKSFISDLADNLSALDNLDSLTELIEEIYGNIACKNSIQAGRVLSIEEMDALLRSMEKVPFSGQCNHGRPTYVKLSVKDLEKIFERT